MFNSSLLLAYLHIQHTVCTSNVLLLKFNNTTHTQKTEGLSHLRDIFHRMGFNDREIVVLSGAHTLGQGHGDRSGFEGPWSTEPHKFDNTFFQDVMKKQWVATSSSKGQSDLFSFSFCPVLWHSNFGRKACAKVLLLLFPVYCADHRHFKIDLFPL